VAVQTIHQLSLLSELSISMRFAQIASRARLHHHIGHRSQEFNLFRLQLLFAATVAWSSRVTFVERLCACALKA
jgi:hypothetical protein